MPRTAKVLNRLETMLKCQKSESTFVRQCGLHIAEAIREDVKNGKATPEEQAWVKVNPATGEITGKLPGQP